MNEYIHEDSFFVLLWLVVPMNLLLAPSGRPSVVIDGLFLSCYVFCAKDCD
jgi:hypothetical protein